MADVGLGQLATTTGRNISRKLKDAIKDAHPLYKAMDENGGIRREDGGYEIVEEAITAQNATTDWVAEDGIVSLADGKIVDAAHFGWQYLMGSVVWTRAERLKNSGGSDTKLIDAVAAKYDALETTQKNKLHEGMLSAGTGSGGLQLLGLAALVPTVVDSGTVGGIDRSSANATWFRNQAFNTAASWSDGAVDAGNVLRFLDEMLDLTIRDSAIQAQLGFLGKTHWQYASQAIGAKQMIVNNAETGKAGFEKLIYRGVPLYFGNGINYSGYTAATVNRSYILNVKRGGVNLVFHKDAEFDLLEPVNSADQAAVSRLMFTMLAMTIGGLAKFNVVGFD